MRRKKPKAEKIRVTIDMSPALYSRLEKLETAAASATKAELIRTSLRVYEAIVERVKEGASIRSVMPDGSEETLVVLT